MTAPCELWVKIYPIWHFFSRKSSEAPDEMFMEKGRHNLMKNRISWFLKVTGGAQQEAKKIPSHISYFELL